MNLYRLFILDVNIKYIVFSILYRHINVPMACKELIFMEEHAHWLPSAKAVYFITSCELCGFLLTAAWIDPCLSLRAGYFTGLWWALVREYS